MFTFQDFFHLIAISTDLISFLSVSKIRRFKMKNSKTQKITIIAMLSALAYVLMLVGRVPMVLFLKYDPKDIIIAIGGFIWGPFASFAVSVIVGFVEMITVSDDGIIGCIMNILSTCTFACTAAFIYKKFHTIYGAFAGLLSGVLAMTAIMLLWNYVMTPIYMGLPRADVAAMLIPIFLPFNMIKGGINMALTLLLYKPIVTALRKAKVIAPSTTSNANKSKANTFGIAVIAIVILATCVLIALSMNGVI